MNFAKMPASAVTVIAMSGTASAQVGQSRAGLDEALELVRTGEVEVGLPAVLDPESTHSEFEPIDAAQVASAAAYALAAALPERELIEDAMRDPMVTEASTMREFSDGLERFFESRGKGQSPHRKGLEAILLYHVGHVAPAIGIADSFVDAAAHTSQSVFSDRIGFIVYATDPRATL